jgi:hypothetical protein
MTRWAMAVVVAVLQPGDAPPAAVTALAARAGVTAPLVRWCAVRAPDRAAGAFAVAAGSAAGGRYLVLGAVSPAQELATYDGAPDLSCYTRAQADRLARALRDSDTLHGALVPRWPTTVVCGFVHETEAACWQFDPERRKFVQVGQWTT